MGARSLFALVAVLLVLSGCAATKLSSTWRDPQFRNVPLKKVAVFVISPDANVRRFAEDQAVRSLPPSTQGVPSYRLFAEPETDIEKVKQRLAAEGFDSALVARLVKEEKGQTYVPPQTHIVPVGPIIAPAPYYRSFYGYYGYAWNYHTYTTPGYVAEYNRVIVETLVYELPGGRPVWSGVSETVNPDSTLDLVNQLVKVVRAQLQQEGIIGAR